MIDLERRVFVRHYLEQGEPIAHIARRLKVSRRTVHYWIERGQLDRDVEAGEVRYGPRPPVTRKLDPYRALIEERLRQYPQLSATRLLAEVKAAGYTGGYTQVKEFVRQVRPREVAEPVVRFETPAGQQAQADWAEFTFPWGKRHALVVVLGFSRLLWFRFYERQDMATLQRGLEEAFAYFGGVPRETLFDQMKSVITRDERARGGRLVENEEFLRFAAHWGFGVRACRPYRAKTKGKVERPVGYVRTGFAYGREFLGDGDLDEQRGRWLEEVANARLHRTTGRVPRELFEERERAALLPLPHRGYRSLVLIAPEPQAKPGASPQPERIEVQRRPLAAYDRIAAGAA